MNNRLSSSMSSCMTFLCDSHHSYHNSPVRYIPPFSPVGYCGPEYERSLKVTKKKIKVPKKGWF